MQGKGFRMHRSRRSAILLSPLLYLLVGLPLLAQENSATQAKKPDPCREAKRLIWEGLYHRVNPDEKEALYAEAVRICPTFASAHNLLGAIHARRGMLEKAQKEFETAIRFNPQFASPHYNLGVLHELRGNRKEAIEAYETALKISPTHLGAQRRLSLLTGMPLTDQPTPQALYDRSLLQLERIVHQNPDSAKAHFDLAEAYAARGRYRDAIAQYREVIDRQPDHAEAHYKLALLYLNHTRMLGGAEVEQRILEELDPLLAEQLARAIHDKEKDEGYLAAVKKMARDFFSRGEEAYERSAYEEALQHLRNTLLYEKDHPEARFLMGLVYTRLGKSHEALQEYESLKPIDREKAEQLYQQISHP
ncbi:MAG: tetratricopeptide repeat protein [Deltaproteobacteria bacterium]|nr:MAG: tetratricopeptide repeat protein [Deltaproteobacteria bacterium]